MKKKIAAILLIAAVLVQTLASCTSTGGSDTTDSGSGTTAGSTTDTSGNDTTSGNGTSAAIDGVSIVDIGNKVAEEFGDEFVPNMDADSETLEATFGIKPEWYSETFAKMPMISFQNDHFIGIHATADHADDVEAALNAYMKDYTADINQYPVNLPKAKAARVYRNGDYVFFILLGIIDDMAEDDANYTTASEANQRAIDIIDSMIASGK